MNNGGAIRVNVTSGKTLEMEVSNCSFTNNFADNGGAILADGVYLLYLFSSNFTNNIASSHGGAIYCSSTSLDFQNKYTNFESNEACEDDDESNDLKDWDEREEFRKLTDRKEK